MGARSAALTVGGTPLTFTGTGTSAPYYFFTTCGEVGRTGPATSTCNAAYSGTSLQGLVTTTGGIQSWTVPLTGSYRIIAAGASGGSATASSGVGAAITADVSLTKGQVLTILVGQRGLTYTSSGGGGGSFVVAAAGQVPLVVGGGGAGSVRANPTATTGNASASTTAWDASDGTGKGGSGGAGGTGSSNGWGGGGGGFLGNGTDAANLAGTRGFSFLNGGLGGTSTGSNNAVGGFGGGGGTHGSTGGGGGGGGYSGGGGSGQSISTASGGGGASYSGGGTLVSSGVNGGIGYVTIHKN